MAAEPTELEALERLIADCDDLQSLESIIDRFNIFDALQLHRREIHHSHFLAWLLTPTQTHGAGDAFLKSLLMDVLRRARRVTGDLPSAVHLDGVSIDYAQVLREDGHTDLLLRIENPAFIVCIENKMHGRESAAKLARYREHVGRRWPGTPAVFVFLNPDGHEAADWIPFAFRELHELFTRVLARERHRLRDDVAAFIQHYLDLLESEFMTDPRIPDLCRRIYANHKAAIDLIIEHADVKGSGILTNLREEIEKLPGGPWTFFNHTGRWLRFAPHAWNSGPIVSNVAGGAAFDARLLLYYEIYADIQNGHIRVLLVVGPGAGTEDRKRLLNRLTGDPNEFGCKLPGKVTPQYTRVFSNTPYRWDTEEEPDAQDALTKTVNAFRLIYRHQDAITIAVREVLS